MEASGPAVVPAYKPASSPDERYRSHQPESSGPADKLTVLWRHRRFLWGVAWKTAIAAYLLAWLLPVHYEGVTKIVPGESQGGSSSLIGKLAGAGGPGGAAGGLGLDPTSILGLKTPGAFYVEVMKSRSVEDRLIDQFDLRRRYTVLGRWFPHIYEVRFLKWLKPGYYNTRKQLKGFTDFEEDKKSGVITVTCTDYDPQIAAELCNAYVAEMNRLAADLNTSDPHREAVFLEERLKSAKQDLDRAALELSQFSTRNAVMDPQTQSRTMLDAAAKVQGELIATESELKGLEQIYAADSIKVRTVRAKVGELQAQLNKMMGSAPSPAGTGASADAPSSPPYPPYPSMRALPSLSYRYSDLYRQAKIQESLYEFLTQQYELAKIQEAKELPTVLVMDRALRPEKKSSPVRTLIAALSVLLALGIASFWVVGQHMWQQLPAGDPHRLLAAEIARDVKAAVASLRSSNS